MRVFKTRLFAKWARKQSVSDHLLFQAVQEIKQGLVDANLGGYVYKKRIALNGLGKRGGARTIVVYKNSESAFFIFGYTKNEKSVLSMEEKKIAKVLAHELLSYSHELLDELVNGGQLIEVASS